MWLGELELPPRSRNFKFDADVVELESTQRHLRFTLDADSLMQKPARSLGPQHGDVEVAHIAAEATPVVAECSVQ